MAAVPPGWSGGVEPGSVCGLRVVLGERDQIRVAQAPRGVGELVEQSDDEFQVELRAGAVDEPTEPRPPPFALLAAAALPEGGGYAQRGDDGSCDGHEAAEAG